MKFILSDFSKILYDWRIKNNLSVTDAAKLFNTDRSNIYRWENGEMVVSRMSFEKIRLKLNF